MAEEPKARRTFFLARHFPPAVEARVAERYNIVRNERGNVLSAAELASVAKGVDYLLVSATETVSREVIAALAGTLKAIGTFSVGFDHVDLTAAREFGVAVFHTPDVLSEACAEIGMLLILNAARRGHEADVLVRSGQWSGWAPTQLLGRGLVGRRLGILGMGRIGREVARRARSFRMSVHYHNRQRLGEALEENAVYHPTAEGLLRVSDVLLICAPANPALRGFLNEERIALLPGNAIVVNISRGDIVDDDALIKALRAGCVFAAGLDVYAKEPTINVAYRNLPNVFLTPHIGSATEETRDAMGFMILDAIRRFEQGLGSPNRLC
jgi:lactate dehydrogenase-like 2-hydroxyacid dehydrogenase